LRKKLLIRTTVVRKTIRAGTVYFRISRMSVMFINICFDLPYNIKEIISKTVFLPTEIKNLVFVKLLFIYSWNRYLIVWPDCPPRRPSP
jgi:hypothetical protein